VIDLANSLIPATVKGTPINGTITQIKVEPGKLRVFVTRVSKELTTALTMYVIPRLPADERAFTAIQRRANLYDDLAYVQLFIRLVGQHLDALQNSVAVVDSSVPSYETSQTYNDQRRDLIYQLNEAHICKDVIFEALKAL
jgi:hypothetical protein